MVFFPSLKSSMIESLAVVNAGAWSELFLRSFTESSAAMESALKVESMTARKESEMTGAAVESACISAAALAARRARLVFCEDAVNENRVSIIIETMQSLAVHLADITLLYMVINYNLVLYVRLQ